MIRGLYTSAVGMMTQMNLMDVVSNNIANADTTGFKKDTVVTQSFSEELAKRLDDPKYKLIKHYNNVGDMSLGVFVNSVHTDFTSGSMKQTEGTLDFALDSEGFFSVSVDGGAEPAEKYTRDGSFTITPAGRLVTKDGYSVMGQNGEIIIPDGEISMTTAGSIYVDGEYIDTLKLVDIENKDSLRKFGDNLYDIIEESVVVPYTGRVLQNYLEESNINPVEEMVKMITLSRVYEANQKLIIAQDDSLQKAVTEIARKS